MLELLTLTAVHAGDNLGCTPPWSPALAAAISCSVCLACSATETLDAEDKFSCDKCGCLQEAQKRIKIKQLPNILCLHLKRFKYVEDLQR